jgi:hypothetical protein
MNGTTGDAVTCLLSSAQPAVRLLVRRDLLGQDAAGTRRGPRWRRGADAAVGSMPRRRVGRPLAPQMDRRPLAAGVPSRAGDRPGWPRLAYPSAATPARRPPLHPAPLRRCSCRPGPAPDRPGRSRAGWGRPTAVLSGCLPVPCLGKVPAATSPLAPRCGLVRRSCIAPSGLPDQPGRGESTVATSRAGTRPGCCRKHRAPGGRSSARARPGCPSRRGSQGRRSRR